MITNRQQSFLTVLKKMPRAWALLIGLLCSAAVAYYIPMVIIALTGVWVNNLLDLKGAAASICILSVINAFAFKIQRPYVTNMSLVLCASAFIFYEMALSRPLQDWPLWWEVYFLLLAAGFLNPFTFIRFRRALDE